MNTAIAVGTVAALTAAAAAAANDHDDYRESQQVANAQPNVEVQAVASLPAKVEPKKPLTEAERIAAAIKHMWIAPCKEWMCLNK